MQRHNHTPPLTYVEAQERVHNGSDIVVIPYTSYMEDDGTVRLSVYTSMAAQAAAVLYRAAASPDTTVVAVGEHTYGLQNVSTTDLIYHSLIQHGVPKHAFAAEHPLQANATPQQISWLQQVYGAAWAERPPVLVGHALHWPRLRKLCDLFELPVFFADALAILESAGVATPAHRRAVTAYNRDGHRYERQAQRLTTVSAFLGSAVTMYVFSVLAALRSPNVVDVHSTKRRDRLYATTVRTHVKGVKKP